MMSERHDNGPLIRNERGISLITVMMVVLIMTLMGISILSVTGFERQISSAVSANEASVAAAESCVSTGAKLIQQYFDNHVVAPAFLNNAVPPGPVPATNLAVLNGEMMTDGGNADIPFGAGSVPNLVMAVGGYQVFGDIDRLYVQMVFGSGGISGNSTPATDTFYRITCVAQNQATGITSQVAALYVCNNPGQFCQLRDY
jgi:Tfp pilus assembly protein PilX